MNVAFEQLVRQMATASPLLAIYVLGAIVAIVRWRRHPLASLWAVLGLGLMTLRLFGGIAAHAFLVNRIQEGGFDNAQGWFFVVGMAGSTAHALGIALLLVAAFAGRGEAPE